MRNYEGVLFEPTIDYQTGLAGPEKRENWRSRHPYLILDTRTHVVRPPSGVRGAASRIGELWEQDAIDDTDTPTLAIKQALAAGIAQTFLDKGNRVIGWPLDENQGHNHPEALDYFTGISFIDLGKTTDAQRAALAIPVNDEKSFWRFINAYTLTVPEIWPSINTRVREINKSKLTNLRIADAAPSSLITFLLREVKEDDGIPETLEPPKIQAMNWVDSACLGSWKLAQVFWFPNKVGEPELKRVVVSTLEGSHAQYGSQGEGLQFKGSVDEIAKELGRRFMIFGSTKEVETDHEVDKDLKPLTPAAWAAMPAVKSLIKTGEFLGDRKLISGEVKIEDLVKSRALKRGLPLLASWSQQAESARCLWEPTIDELVVTITGKLGGSKTKMTPKDLVAVRPKPGTQNDLLLRKVKGRKTLSPSVEAREFAIPLYKMGESEEGFKFKVRRNQDGSYTPDENGKFDMWRIVGIDHLHRDVKVDQINRDKIIVIEPEDYDAVGCGVDANDEKSEYAIKQAYKQGLEFFNERGYWPTSAVFYVPNHGWNAILFANENQQGNFDSDLGKGFRDAIENGDLVYGTFAEGVTQV